MEKASLLSLHLMDPEAVSIGTMITSTGLWRHPGQVDPTEDELRRFKDKIVNAPTAEAKRGEGAAPLDSAQFKRQAPLGGIKPKGGGLQKLDRLAAPSNLPSLAGKSDALGPLPSLQELQDQMAGRRRAAEEAFARNQELLRERDAQQDRLMSQAGVSKQDMEQRAAHLAQQVRARDAVESGRRRGAARAIRSLF